MSELPLITLILVAFLVVFAIILVAATWKRRREGRPEEPDFRAFFSMGIAWFAAGLVIMGIALLFDVPFLIGLPLTIMGIVYLALGLSNRDKWQSG